MDTRHFAFWPKRLTKELYYPQVPLFSLLETSTKYYPNKTAICYYGKEIQYSELGESILSLAAALNKIGVDKGDRVALCMQNTPHFVISYFGIMRANAVVVPVNPMLLGDELAFLFRDSGAEVVITSEDLLPKVQEAGKTVSIKEIIVADYKDYLPEKEILPVPDFLKANYAITENVTRFNDILTASAQPPPVEVGVNDLCMLPYTSGSTGKPKGCMHNHYTVISNLVSAYHWFNYTSKSVVLSALPLFHVTGLIHCLLAPIYAGSEIVILTRWDRETALSAIEQKNCTHWVNISTMVVDLLASPNIDQRDLSSLMAIGGGGAPLPRAVGEKLKNLTGLDYVEGYGLTETISQTHFNPPDRPKLQCIGIPDFGVDARIINVDSGEELPPNSEGELIINGPEVFTGYWNRPEEDKEAFIEIDGKAFFKTGDVCFKDEEGYYFIVDRTKRMINAAGFKVWPAEVENHLYKHKDILETCVVGVPHPKKTEEIRAYIVLKEEAKGKVKEEEIINWAKEQMAAYKYPREIIFIEALPKSGTGKILWKQLQDQARQESN